MEWKEFKQKYEDREISVSIDKKIAMFLLKKKNPYTQTMFSAKKQAHYLWLTIMTICLWTSIISFGLYFYTENINIWIPIGLFIAGFILNSSVQKTACQFIIEECLDRAGFYESILQAEEAYGLTILNIKTIKENS